MIFGLWFSLKVHGLQIGAPGIIWESMVCGGSIEFGKRGQVKGPAGRVSGQVGRGTGL